MANWREARLHKELPVRVRGKDYDGNPFIQETHTLDISRRGARLEWLTSIRGAGEFIEVERGRERARFRVVWTGHIGTAQDGQIGIVTLEPLKYIWGEPLPAPQRVDEPQEVPMKDSEPAPATPRDLRKRPRYRCIGGAQVWQEGAESSLSATLTEVSQGGCYLETTWPLPVGTHVQLHLRCGDFEFAARGKVNYLDPSMGMGIVFSDLSDDARRGLLQLVDRLSGNRPMD